ncbi:MAG: hypothetical protein ACT4PL_10600, partial [Phycisphaerales bacterium]
RTTRTVLFNITFALAAIAIMVTAVLSSRITGWPVPLWLGVIGHEGGTLLVVMNSLLLLGYRGVPVCGFDRAGGARPAPRVVAVTVAGRPTR